MTEERVVFDQLYRLQVDYWHDVDHNYGRDATRFYVEDGVFEVGSERMSGRAEIAAFYEWREQRGQRTARHLVSNCRLKRFGAESAEFECVMTLYANDGLPVLNSQPPVLIADVVDHCLCDGEVWRFKSHVLTPIFQGGVNPTVPTRSELLSHKAEKTT